MHVVIASKNPTKVNAVREAFTAVFDQPVSTWRSSQGGQLTPEVLEITSVLVDSGVGEQPVGDEQTMQGALQRAQIARTAQPEADFWVGVEGGVVWYGDELECMAWVAVLGVDGRVGKARSNGFLLPPAMATLIRSGVKQDLADDQVFGRENSGTTNGTVGYLSHNLITRTHYTADAVILALAPFVHPEHYPAEVSHPTEVTVS